MDPLGRIRQRAKSLGCRIVLPEYKDERMYGAAAEVVRSGLAKIVMCGEPETIASGAAKAGLDLKDIEVIDHLNDVNRAAYIAEYAKLRAHRGMTDQKAEGVLSDSLFYGAMLVRMDRADGMVAGARNSTSKVLRALIQIVGPAPGIRTVSSLFLMATGRPELGVDGLLVYADCGAVPNPDAKQLADIAGCAARSCRLLLEVEPRVAMLSYSSRGSAKGPLVDKVIHATSLFRERYPNIAVDGELQVDAALIPEVAARKVGKSPVAGKANVLIFPDLNAGNIAYKITERVGGAQAIGPIVQGLAKPGNDLSRGCGVSDIVNAVAVTCVQAKAAS